MAKTQYIYDIDDSPPLRFALVYGLQWAILMFPAFIIAVTLSGRALQMDVEQEIRFLQLTLLVSGAFTLVQTLQGHRYPVLDGPATALLLTFIVLAPFGVETIQGGTILGGILLIAIVLSGKLNRVISYATPNVVGVILMLIALTLIPYLSRSMAGIDGEHPQGNTFILLMSIALVILMATFSYRFSGFLKTIALLIGIVLGSVIFALVGLLDLQNLSEARWVALAPDWIPGRPRFYWPAVFAFASAYLAVMVNSLGSLHGIATITDTERLPRSLARGIFMNGAAGICCGLLGIVGLVSYSMGPGVVLANRVASRYTVAYCGIILMIAAFVPKLAALLALVPTPVVGAALCTAMGAQFGAGLSIVSAGGLASRDYFVVGLPVLIGTLVGFLPDTFISAAPSALRVFLGNGLIVGIFLVLLLEHLFLRKKIPDSAGG